MSKIFGHYVPFSIVLLAFAEFFIIYAAFYGGVAIRFADGSVGTELEYQLQVKAFLFALSMFASMIAVGLYIRGTREGFSFVIVKLMVACVLAFFLLVALYYIVPSWFVGRGVFLLSILLSFIGLSASRYLYSHVINTNLITTRILVIGTGQMAIQLKHLRRKSDWRGLTLVGFLHLKGDKDEVDENEIIRSPQSLTELVTEYGIDEIVVAIEEQRKNYPVDQIIECKMKGIRVTEICDFFERHSGLIQIDTLHPGRFIFIEGFQQSYFRNLLKRVVDITLSSLILIVTLPVYPILVLLIKRESGWSSPAFYQQTRIGQGENKFNIYKFRSMVVNAESDGAQWAQKNDTRVTRIGKIIRKTRLDELPQLWNVLKGDMSFVGPRPERPEFVEILAGKIPYYRMRHRVKPGITGWAQVCYPYGDDAEDAKKKLQFDLYYIKNYSVFLDLTILAQTLQVILWQKGAR